MASVKIVLRKKPNKDGTYPLALRITQNRKSSYIYLHYNLKAEQWDATHSKVKKSHPNSSRLNNLLLQKLAEANSLILDYELKKKELTADELKRRLGKKQVYETVFGQADLYLSTLKQAQNYNRLVAEQSAFNHFRRFLKGKDISFSEMTVSLLERFKAYLKGSVKVSERTAVNYLIILRTLYKRAIKEGIVDKQHYPFGMGKFHVKKPESLKIGLNIEEVKRIEELDLSDEYYFINHARNIWLFSFYFAGMRVSDVLQIRWSDFKNDRLYYVMGKNNKAGSLKIPSKVIAILDQYRDDRKSNNDLVFPDLRTITDFSDKEKIQRRVKLVNRKINKALKTIAELAEIEKKVTMHIARHSFGNISGDKIPVQMLQKLYRHSSITTTVNYQKNFLFKSADNALDEVLDF